MKVFDSNLSVRTNKPTLILLIAFAAGGLFLILTAPYYYFTTKEKMLNVQFGGTVDNVSYTVKGTPTILIKGVKYDLPVNYWNFNREIQQGDSMVKKRNSMVVKIFKKDGKLIVEQ